MVSEAYLRSNAEHMGKFCAYTRSASNEKKIHMSRFKGNTPLTDRARGVERFWENLEPDRASTFNEKNFHMFRIGETRSPSPIATRQNREAPRAIKVWGWF